MYVVCDLKIKACVCYSVSLPTFPVGPQRHLSSRWVQILRIKTFIPTWQDFSCIANLKVATLKRCAAFPKAWPCLQYKNPPYFKGVKSVTVDYYCRKGISWGRWKIEEIMDRGSRWLIKNITRIISKNEVTWFKRESPVCILAVNHNRTRCQSC